MLEDEPTIKVVRFLLDKLDVAGEVGERYCRSD